ncbi:MAG TPA: DUF362 domain-containing protein [Polyangiaceae bacterium]|nr:DUF362 domain-containing protein [Polyangiaceae bacterium]
MSSVAFKRVTEVTRDGVERALRDVIAPVAPGAETMGSNALVKLNAMSDELFPGRNTSPWVLDAMLVILRERYPRTRWTIVDTDVAGSRQFERACKNWGYDEIARKHGIAIENLASGETVPIKTGNPVVPAIELPKRVLDASAIVNLPVLKTHVMTGITCALKNHWGLLPRMRYQFHPFVHDTIAEINRQITNTVLTVVDGTVCIEGAGPKTGAPRVANVLLAGRDRVAIDSAVLRFIGMNPRMAPHVKLAETAGVGSTEFELVGDPFAPEPFDLPREADDVVSWLERRIRRLPVIGRVSYWPPLAEVLGLIGTKYNKHVWMRVHGKKHVDAMRQHPEHGPQYATLGS